MKIEEINVKLPKENAAIERFFHSCDARRKFIDDSDGHYKSHLKKAKHDLSRAIAEFNDECWDWTVIKAYYAIHHAGNALFSGKNGKFSKDHSCLIIALNHYKLIPQSLFNELVSINEKFSDILSLDITFQLRKIGQYGVDEWEELTKDDAKLILEVAKRLVSFVEESL